MMGERLSMWARRQWQTDLTTVISAVRFLSSARVYLITFFLGRTSLGILSVLYCIAGNKGSFGFWIKKKTLCRLQWTTCCGQYTKVFPSSKLWTEENAVWHSSEQIIASLECEWTVCFLCLILHLLLLLSHLTVGSEWIFDRCPDKKRKTYCSKLLLHFVRNCLFSFSKVKGKEISKSKRLIQ